MTVTRIQFYDFSLYTNINVILITPTNAQTDIYLD